MILKSDLNISCLSFLDMKAMKMNTNYITILSNGSNIILAISKIKFTKNSSDAEKALMLYFGQLPKEE